MSPFYLIDMTRIRGHIRSPNKPESSHVGKAPLSSPDGVPGASSQPEMGMLISMAVLCALSLTACAGIAAFHFLFDL